MAIKMKSVLLAALLMASCQSFGAGFKYFDYTIAYLGVDYTYEVSHQCQKGGTNDHLTSNMGFRQHLIGKGDLNIVFNYTHHSCVINSDRLMYDGAGFQLEWKF